MYDSLKNLSLDKYYIALSLGQIMNFWNACAQFGLVVDNTARLQTTKQMLDQICRYIRTH